MREIKFRAWDKDLKQMGFILGIYLTPNGWVDMETEPGDSGEEWGARLLNVDLMQFTGLHDKNGKEIYEGDVVKSQFPYNDKFLDNIDGVVWHIETAGFMLGPRMCNDRWILEVIGNIYENPELLNKAR